MIGFTSKATSSGNLVGALNDAPKLPVGRYVAEIVSGTLRKGAKGVGGLGVELVFKIVSPEQHAGAMISEWFQVTGQGADREHRSLPALRAVALATGVGAVDDLRQLWGRTLPIRVAHTVSKDKGVKVRLVFREKENLEAELMTRIMQSPLLHKKFVPPSESAAADQLQPELD